jgi:hypothetical protein
MLMMMLMLMMTIMVETEERRKERRKAAVAGGDRDPGRDRGIARDRILLVDPGRDRGIGPLANHPGSTRGIGEGRKGIVTIAIIVAESIPMMTRTDAIVVVVLDRDRDRDLAVRVSIGARDIGIGQAEAEVGTTITVGADQGLVRVIDMIAEAGLVGATAEVKVAAAAAATANLHRSVMTKKYPNLQPPPSRLALAFRADQVGLAQVVVVVAGE